MRRVIDFKRLLEFGKGKSLSEYGFMEPDDDSTELLRERTLHYREDEVAKLTALNLQYPNNPEQTIVYDTIMNDLDDDVTECRYYFISGPGGVGKSEVCKKLHAAIRARGHVIKICAATTLAAAIFEGAETAHSAFKFPVVDEGVTDPEDRTECNLKEHSQRVEFYRHCRVIFWDEFVNSHRELFEAVMRAFNTLHINVIFVCCGDFRQILPVVKSSIVNDTIEATISSSPYWHKFTVLHLKQNMRLLALQRALPSNASEQIRTDYTNQLAYSSTILALAAGRAEGNCILVESKADIYLTRVAVKGVQFFTEEEEQLALSWLYPDGFNPSAAVSACVLAATNKSGDHWNAVIQSTNPSAGKTYISNDYLSEVDDPHGKLKKLLNPDLLNYISVSGVPAHTLKLKINDVCLVMRSMLSIGLATNQRVKILEFGEKYVVVCTLDEAERRVVIPRIRFNFNLEYGDSYKIMRTQIPLRLAYCMTYNKSQGQTLGKVLLDITEEPFAHGHCYVALSRVRSSDHIRIFTLKDNLYTDPDNPDSIAPIITNVVYPQVLIEE